MKEILLNPVFWILIYLVPGIILNEWFKARNKEEVNTGLQFILTFLWIWVILGFFLWMITGKNKK